MTTRPTGARTPGRRIAMSAVALGVLLGLGLGATACSSTGETVTSSGAGPLNSVESTTEAGSSPAEATDSAAADAAQASEGTEPPASEYTGGTPAPNTEQPAATDAGSPPVATSGPAPGSGNINETVPNVAVVTTDAGGFDAVGDFGGSVTARLAQIDAIEAQAELPGEISGPAVALTIEIANDSDATIGLDSVTVDITDGNGNPTNPMSSAPAQPFSGVLEPGQTATAVYVITVPLDARTNMAVTVSYAADAPVLKFTGNL